MIYKTFTFTKKKSLLSSLIVKEIEDKSIVWFQNSNQYLILEHLAAKIVSQLVYKKSIKDIANRLEKELAIPYEKAIDFIIDVDEKIVKPNQEKTPDTLNTQNIQKPESFEYTKFYKIHTKTIKVEFSNEFELSLIHPKFAHLEADKSEKFDCLFQSFSNGNYTYLVIDNKLIGSWSKKDIHYFQGKFSMKVIETIYEKSENEWIGVFHASAIGKEDESILVLGDSGNGKSTSLALLQAHGFHCIADDFVPMDNLKKIHAFPAGISIKKNSLNVLLPFYPELESSAEFHYERLKKIVRYLPPKEINYKNSHPCKALIFIKYNSEIEFELNKISNLKAFESLLPDSWISPLESNVVTFLDWFSLLPCYELIYSNNKKMITTVKELLEK